MSARIVLLKTDFELAHFLYGESSVSARASILVRVQEISPVTLTGQVVASSKAIRQRRATTQLQGQASTSAKEPVRFRVPSKEVLFEGVGLVSLSAQGWKWKTVQGQVLKGSSSITAFPVEGRDIQQDMYDYIPKYYTDSAHATGIVQTEANEFVRFHANLKDALNQFHPNTATWSLDKWEKMFNLEKNSSLSIEERRSALRERLEGVGTLTVNVLKSHADRYYESEIDDRPAEYLVNVIIKGVRGEPDNLTDMSQHLRDIIPAHLGVDFTFTYVFWNELEKITWDQLESRNKNWHEFERWFPLREVW